MRTYWGARVSIKFLTLIGVFTAVLIAVTLDRLFGAGLSGVVIGCLVAAVVVLLLDRDVNGLAGAVVFGGGALAAVVALVVQQVHSLGWGKALAIDSAVVVLAAFALWFAIFGRHRMAAARLCRRAAQGLGWRYRKPDTDLLRRARLAFPTVPGRVRTLYAAADGTVDGFGLTFVTGRVAPQAWLARLPFGLPQVLVRPGGRAPDGTPLVESMGGDTAFRDALLTPAVVGATVAGDVTMWRIERDDVVVVFRRADGSEAIQHHAAHVARLVRSLPLAELRAHAIDPDSVPDPKQWAERVENRRVGQRLAAGIGAGLAALVMCCGFYNVRIPSHARGSIIMLWIGGGLILLATLLWFAVPRDPSRADRKARTTAGTSSAPRDG